jgi:hypothetical protein
MFALNEMMTMSRVRRLSAFAGLLMLLLLVAGSTACSRDAGLDELTFPCEVDDDCPWLQVCSKENLCVRISAQRDEDVGDDAVDLQDVAQDVGGEDVARDVDEPDARDAGDVRDAEDTSDTSDVSDVSDAADVADTSDASDASDAADAPDASTGCTSSPCRAAYTCSMNQNGGLQCDCAESACTEADNHCGDRGIFYAKFAEKDQNLTFGTFTETVTVHATGEIDELFAGVGGWSFTMAYDVQISGQTSAVNYGRLTFSANIDQGLDYSEPTVNMGKALLNPPFPVTAGETLQITISGSGGHLHAYSDGTHRMTLRGRLTSEACPVSVPNCTSSSTPYVGSYTCAP